MKGIILAAGEGSRLGVYTRDLPKCMLNFLGKSLLERQIDAYNSEGISDIVVIRKYLAHKINVARVRYIEGAGQDENMVGSLFKARQEFNDDLIISYGDIIFEPTVLRKVIEDSGEVGIVADKNWKDYWIARHGSIEEDSESFVIDKEKKVRSLGKKNPQREEMDARYVGIVKFSKNSLWKINNVHDNAAKSFWNKPWYTSESFKKACMTDFLQALIDSGIDVRAIEIDRGWLEFDTASDYENTLKWLKEGKLNKFYKL